MLGFRLISVEKKEAKKEAIYFFFAYRGILVFGGLELLLQIYPPNKFKKY
jgi:hypothetical protein